MNVRIMLLLLVGWLLVVVCGLEALPRLLIRSDLYGGLMSLTHDYVTRLLFKMRLFLARS